MAAPFRAQRKSFTFKRLVESFHSATGQFPDARTGNNTRYSMQDAALGAFSVFFTQSPSFLDFQRTMQVTKGCSNAHSLFGMRQIPTDVHIRNLLDPVSPTAIFPVFADIVDGLRDVGYLEAYRSSTATCWCRWTGPNTSPRRRFIARIAASSNTRTAR